MLTPGLVEFPADKNRSSGDSPAIVVSFVTKRIWMVPPPSSTRISIVGGVNVPLLLGVTLRRAPDTVFNTKSAVLKAPDVVAFIHCLCNLTKVSLKLTYS